jgi:hypothetical protein
MQLAANTGAARKLSPAIADVIRYFIVFPSFDSFGQDCAVSAPDRPQVRLYLCVGPDLYRGSLGQD